MVREVGFFKEHGIPGAGSIHDVRLNTLSVEERKKIESYLQGGSLIATTGQLVRDFLVPTRVDVARQEVRTDGEWVWPADLAYYVAEYGIDLPLEFKEHLTQSRFSCVPLTNDELVRVVHEYIGIPQ